MGKIVVNGLVEKRAEIAGEIREIEQQLRALRGSLSHLDATIHLLDPGIELSQMRPKRRRRKNSLFADGELGRCIREVLRDAGDTALSTVDITKKVLAQRGLDQDAAALKTASAAVSRALYRLEQTDQVRKAGYAGINAALWVRV